MIAKEIRELAESSKDNSTKIRDVISEVITAVKELIAGSRELLDFISSNVNQDYHKFIETIEGYNDDSYFINDMVTDFSGTSQELFASLETVMKQIEDIAGFAKNSSQKVNQIFYDVQALTDDSASLVKETDLLNDSSFYLKESISEFNFNHA